MFCKENDKRGVNIWMASAHGHRDISCHSLARFHWLTNHPLHTARHVFVISGGTRERQRGGGQKSPGGGQNLTRRPPTENSFPTPLTSVRFTPLYPVSLMIPQNFPQVTSSETIFGGSQKWFVRGHHREVLLFGTFCPPPLALPGGTDSDAYCQTIWCSVMICSSSVDP